ncbi:MAG: sigma-70 family RNA polymerase sigma factor, partial [Candidatus Poribacteria bacterium]|nr:sigma-70 family RNA polymerase sigma factor [Candidatus Poribacteria bacterium]
MVENDIQLIHRILSGDEAAFSALVRKYQKSVHALAWRKIGDFHIAEEIAQDAFLQAYKNLARLRNPNQFAGWLYVIASNLCKRWHQSNKPAMQSLDDASVGAVEGFSYRRYVSEQREVEAMEHRHEIVKELLETLPESERTVVTLYYLGEMTAKEIGNFLGVSVNTIKSRLRRARERLQAEEHLISETLGSAQLPPNFIERIMQQVADIKPAPPSVGKPLLPWIAFGTAALLIMLMIGIGSQYLSRFQRPYTLNAESETTVEIIDTPLVIDTQAEPDVRNQAGRSDTTGRGSGAGPQISKPVVPAPAQIEKELLTPPQQWRPASVPASGPVGGLLVSSNGDIYAASRLGVYRLTPDTRAWTFLSPTALETPTEAPPMIPMAEQNGTLYLISDAEVLISTDSGETWEPVGTRPEGVAVALTVTEEALYLLLRDKGVFRSEDMGQQWTPLGGEVTDRKIFALATIENTVFVGTNQGLYRINPRHNSAMDIWEKLPLTTPKTIHSLGTAENNLYVGTGPELDASKREETREQMSTAVSSGQPAWEVFRSTDFGDSWTEITPTSEPALTWLSPGIKVLTAGKTLWALGYTGFQCRSTDAGETWTHHGYKKLDALSMMNSLLLSVFPAVGMNENILFKASPFGLIRSTDAGESWHPFMTGMVGTQISNLVAFKNALYAYTGTNIAKSTDGGMSWRELRFSSVKLTPELGSTLAVGLFMRSSQLAIFDDKLYCIGTAVAANIGEAQQRIFHLSENGGALVLMPEIPVLGENLSIEPPKTASQEMSERNTPDEVPNDPEKANESTDTTPESIESHSAFAVSGETFYVEYQ